jgi:apolipoprotein N-acyltransferase
VDNALVNQLAPWTGVYGISFVLVRRQCAAGGRADAGVSPHIGHRDRMQDFAGDWSAADDGLRPGFRSRPPARAHRHRRPHPAQSRRGRRQSLDGPGEWEQPHRRVQRLAGEQCKTYIAGIPQTGAPNGEIVCPPYPTHPDLVVWPESPAPFFERRPLSAGAHRIASPGAGSAGGGQHRHGFLGGEAGWHYYNSALVVGADGARVGRYDKIHLVPFGEYIPFKNLLFFARKLTGRVSEFTRGEERKVFRCQQRRGHRYGVFICYESVFADEVRQFAQLGAEVLVNISDDGWYGDTSAPGST